jgi:hypothetical protein
MIILTSENSEICNFHSSRKTIRALARMCSVGNGDERSFGGAGPLCRK